MAFLEVDGTAVKTPSFFSVSIQDISQNDSGRTLDGIMHKNRITSKRTIELAWVGCSPSEAKLILDAFSPEYFSVKYYDPQSGNSQVTKRFYVGDRTAPIKHWSVNGKIYEKISFNIIER